MATVKLSSLMQSTSVKFGTSGVRGLVAEMTEPLCYAYAKAFLGAVAGESPRVVVGHDLRPSSPRIAAACLAAIRDAGKTAIYAGALPTPALAYHALLCNAPAIVVTGSHIPFDRNGIKFYCASGEISKADEALILQADVAMPDIINMPELPAPDPRPYQHYVARYVEFFGPQALAGARVALYQHSSVARDILADILQQMGCEVLALGRTNEFVPIDTEAVRAEDVVQARQWAASHRFDAIFSTDGDADRPLLGDETGQWLRGDIVGLLCASYLQVDWVVAPVSCNTVLEKCGRFRQVVRTRIGSPYVIEAMEQAPPGAVVAGFEANGGFLLGTDVQGERCVLKALPTRDAVLPMLALLCMARAQGVPLSQLCQSLPARFTHSDRLQEIPTTASQQLLGRLEQDSALVRALVPHAGAVVQMDQTDGLRLQFDNGDIVHFRPSGNAPELRCYSEADSLERARYLCDESLTRVRGAI